MHMKVEELLPTEPWLGINGLPTVQLLKRSTEWSLRPAIRHRLGICRCIFVQQDMLARG
jgi:hypothetical protein